MSSSIRDLILDDIHTTLAGITLANHYETDIQAVENIRQVGLNIKESPMIVIVAGEEAIVQEALGKETSIWKIDLEVWIKDPDDIVTAVNNMIADVTKALLADHQRGARAIDTKIISNYPFYPAVNAPEGGVVITIEIHYRTKYGDPYTQG